MKRVTRSYSGTTDAGVSKRELENRKIARKAATEGMVLLENKNGFLPLKRGSKIALYGSGADKTIKGGTGSGDVNERDSVTIYQGLRGAGFQVTTSEWIDDYNRTYDQARQDWKADILSRGKDAGLNEFFHLYSSTPFEIPGGRPVSEEDADASETDTAVFVISRVAGEGADRYAKAGDYYLLEEEKKNLDFICGHYDHVLLVINAGGQVDLSFTREYESLEAIVYMVQAGMEGGNALGDLLRGKENFSGKLTDTWAENYQDYPSAKTFSHNNGNVEEEYYEEGIYVGYRYFDTFGIKPRYSFGYGLSYTDFRIQTEAAAITADEEKRILKVQVPVKNTGSLYSGKEVVQVYGSCPQGKLEKEIRRLCGFGKTGLLAPGEEETLTIEFPAKQMASFDQERNSWVLEAGSYGIWIGESLKDAKLTGAIGISQETVVEQVREICPPDGELKELQADRAYVLEFERNWMKELEEMQLPILTYQPGVEVLPEKVGIPQYERALQLVENLDREELISMVVGEVSRGQGSTDANALGSAGIMVPGAAGETSSVLEDTYDIPGISMADGPAGLRLKQSYEVSAEDGSIIPANPFDAFEGGFFSEPQEHENASTYYQYCTAIPVGALLAQTWNPSLLEEVGEMVGSEMEYFHVSWWLAPGLNIHRNPLCGRNFEYYSEDPLVSGKIAGAITRGVQRVGGVGTTIKHFACNNQEDNRMGSNSILSQRALREIYLRGFEIAVKESQPMAIMTSYNLINGVHAANSHDLCMKVARQEWGFDGIIMTDWTTTSSKGGSQSWLCVQAGNDLIMPGTTDDYEDIRKALEEKRLDPADLKACAARIISLVLQSNAYENSEGYGKKYADIKV